MEKIDMVFVVLHYIVEHDTIECVKSIEKWVDTRSYRIIIVDNASPNDSFRKIQTTFFTDKKVVLIQNKDNLGFANGNNVGIQYARANFDVEFIAVINNDTMLIEDGIFCKLKHEYKISQFAVLGPMIYTHDGTCNSNPYRKKALSYEDVCYLINEISNSLFWGKMHMESIYLKFHRRRNVDMQYEAEDFLSRQVDVVLHGCFLVFSKNFFKYYQGFDGGTFLYVEEDILYWLLHKKNLVTVYLPDIRIYHKEDISTNAITSKRTDRRLRRYSNLLKSYQRLSIIMRENHNE